MDEGYAAREAAEQAVMEEVIRLRAALVAVTAERNHEAEDAALFLASLGARDQDVVRLEARLAAAEQAERELLGERATLRAALVPLVKYEPAEDGWCFYCEADLMPPESTHAADCPIMQGRAALGADAAAEGIG